MVRFFVMMGFALFQSIFALFALDKLNLNAQATGLVLTFIGFYSVLVQGVGIGLLTKRFNENKIIIGALWLMFLGFIGWSLTPNLPVMLLVILPLAGGGWVANTILTSGITKAVAPEEIGGMLGFSTSLESITRVISPIIGGILFAKIGMGEPAMFSAVMLLCAIWLAYRRIILVKPIVEAPPIEGACT